MVLVRYTFLFFVLSRAGSGLLLGMIRYGADGFSLGAILNGITLLLGAAAIVKQNRPSLQVPALIWLPYLTIACYSLAYTPDPFDGARLFLSILTFPAIFISAFVFLRSDRDTIIFLKYIIYSSIAPVLYGMIQLAASEPSVRLNSTFGHANIFAFYIVAVLVSILYHNILVQSAANSAWRYFSRIYSAVLCGMLLATQTRSAWIEAVFILVAYAVSVNRKFLLALPLLPLALYFPFVADRLNSWDSGYGADASEVMRGQVVLESYAWREMLWKYALIDSADDRVFGKGIESFHYNSPNFFPLEQTDGDHTDAHSGYVQAIYELGIPGLVAYVGLYVGLILAVWRLRRADRRLTNLIIAFIVGNLIINYSDNLPYYLDYNWYAWGIFGADLSWRLRRAGSPRENCRGFDQSTAACDTSL